ncbi:large ribosomal subunit protein uL10-like [Corticium candelabrum]|uniref:large ribosomal subunit protein uL10-like n=1 Tax=Corticium candelabrum TaxID=121492 RepID=UPI002E27542D|nr:large ribosomal subunit protein uL10-like [Corticium candelabrum]
MVKGDKAVWKSEYFLKLQRLIEEYPKIFIVGADNVGSRQMQQIRMSLRGMAVVLMGKNTMIRKALRTYMESNPALEKLLPFVKGNVGFVFTNGDLKEVRDKLLENKVAAPAKAGALAPIDVFVPKGNTFMGPEKTSFFQALSIATKISRGTIEILNDVHLIKEGSKVGASESTLLQMLKIMPFFYGLKIFHVYEEGSVFSPSILDISDDDLRQRFMAGVSNVACVSLAIGYPTVASVPHSIVNGFKNLLAVAVATDIDFKEADMAKQFLADPSAFQVAAPVAAVVEEEVSKEEAKEEEEEESDDDMGLGLFD